jgi:hypothetical protein
LRLGGIVAEAVETGIADMEGVTPSMEMSQGSSIPEELRLGRPSRFLNWNRWISLSKSPARF